MHSKRGRDHHIRNDVHNFRGSSARSCANNMIRIASILVAAELIEKSTNQRIISMNIQLSGARRYGR